jgi:hexosaminidase
MKKHVVLFSYATLCFFVLACSQKRNEFDPSKIEMRWKLIQNNDNDKPRFRASLSILNHSDYPIPATGWKLYFNLRYHGHDLTSVSPEFSITHVSGELFAIQPTANFKGLDPGKTTTLDYSGTKRIANFQDIPGGFFWINDHSDHAAISVADPTLYTDDQSEKLPIAEASSIYESNKRIADIPLEKLPPVFPTPMRYVTLNESFQLSSNTVITGDKEFETQGRYLVEELGLVLGSQLRIQRESRGTPSIILRKKTMGAEAYHLKVDDQQILIEANDKRGIFYGIQSLKTLIPPEAWNSPQQTIAIKGVEVNDAPRFPFRAFMLDVARNFHSKEKVLKVLELMALYKLNVFHFHLSDDEGWRLEIPGLPELTEVGGKRGVPFDENQQLHPSYRSGISSSSSGSGFYTKEDYIEIVKYAADRQIRVVPEIESPGHARAAIKAMEARYDKFVLNGFEKDADRYLLHDKDDQSTYLSNQYFKDNVMNVALPSTYVFIEKVIDEIIDMHKAAGAPLTAIHMAGDEVPFGSWEKSPKVKSFLQNHPAIKSTKDLWTYYFEQIKSLLRKKGLSIYGWQELVVGTQTEGDGTHLINSAFVSDDLQIDAWWNINGNEDIPYKLANAGYKTVMTCFDQLYFDLAYQKSFDEPGDAWVGYLDIDRIFSFIPLDYYRNFKTDVKGNPFPENFFDGKDLLTERGKSNIVGIQGALWGENLVSAELMEYMLFPRLLALAERAWAPDPLWAQEQNSMAAETFFNESWSLFVNTLGKRELPRLDYYKGGVNYRIPTPGAIVSEEKVIANIQLPGLAIRYTTDGTEPVPESALYESPITDKKLIKLKAFDQRKRSGHTISVQNN